MKLTDKEKLRMALEYLKELEKDFTNNESSLAIKVRKLLEIRSIWHPGDIIMYNGGFFLIEKHPPCRCCYYMSPIMVEEYTPKKSYEVKKDVYIYLLPANEVEDNSELVARQS